FKMLDHTRLTTQLTTSYNAEEKIWSGAGTQSSYNDDLTIAQLIFNQLQSEPERVFQICIAENTELTRGQMLENATKISAYLRQEGLTEESHNVGILARNTTHLATLAYGCIFNGTPFSAVNPNMDEAKICDLFNLIKPQIIFCAAEDYEKATSVAKLLGAKIITINGSSRGVTSIADILITPLQKDYKTDCFRRSSDSTMAILHTSGSTGAPKAVTIPNNPILFEAFSYLGANDVQYTPSSLDWVSGLIKLITSGVNGTLSLISEQPFSPAHFMTICEKYNISWAMLGVSQVALLVNSPEINANQLKSIRYLIIVGGRIQPKTVATMESYLPGKGILCMAYGMTEMVTPLANNFSTHTRPTSVGRLLPIIRMRVVDENGKNLGPNEVGELYIDHGQHWSGYYQNAVATNDMRDSEGWFHTGDLGYFDDDNYLYVVDRKKDLLKYMRMSYYPNEIEEVISQIPEVAEVCVFGIWSELKGDAATASVVIREGSTLKAAQVVDFVASKISVSYKHLHGGVQFVSNLARSPNGKVNRRAVKEAFLKANQIE
ncbi:hypothetical protein KR215_007793, partial [Drosophila sulfurigaster]